MSDTNLITITLDIEATLDRAKSIKITDDDARLKASESRKQVKQWEKAIGAKFDPEVEALYVPYKEKLAERKEYLDTLKTLDGVFKKAIEDYDREVERKAREVAANEEAKRLKALADNPVPAGEAVQGETAFVLPSRPKAAGEYGVEVWEIEVVNFAELPDEFKVADQGKLNSVAKTMKDLTKIPGTKVTSRKDIRQRA